ncbi:hypothetical protein N865_05315 [Intrasporangium oryzae NRRL B-24470]|uniref:Uncharacterized protein n=1 Tax=Intrasporangium oryzae NRRL B-24470 TaxID=1386089 RepID=W9G926_9MICO|nr:hypothetical protein [Intrasporangium oryzae]EWT02520.1 hypothetical protein N865_05315 [Intrasporangium oryzae NRRL B-24470]
MELSRLETVSPALAARILSASPDSARQFAFQAAELACAAVRLDDPAVLEALAVGTRGRLPSPGAIEETSRLCADFEQAYFEALATSGPGVGGDDAGMLRSFALARAASAVVMAARADAHEAAIEAAYETWTVTDDLDGLEDLASRLL